jgi:hypothetical protein
VNNFIESLLITVIYDFKQNPVDCRKKKAKPAIIGATELLPKRPRQTTAVPFPYGDVHTPLSKEQQ